MEIFYECNEKPVLDDKASVFEKSKMIKTEMPTELRQWLKEQMRAIENKTLDEDKTKKILDMLDEWIYTFHAEECSKIIDELKEERIKQLEEKNKQLEIELKKMTKRKQVYLEGYKKTLEQLAIERIDWRGKSNLICANACLKNCNHIQAWFGCNHTMCIESAKYCGQCIECGKKPTDMRRWLKEIPTNE